MLCSSCSWKPWEGEGGEERRRERGEKGGWRRGEGREERKEGGGEEGGGEERSKYPVLVKIWMAHCVPINAPPTTCSVEEADGCSCCDMAASMA